MNNIIQDLTEWINRQEKHIIIGITGHGGAGKTTFADQLKQVFCQDANLICTDPYIVHSALRRDTQITYTFQNEVRTAKMTACHPLAHYTEALERDIQMTLAGMEWSTIDRDYLPSKLIDPNKKLTIFEGMSVAFINPDYLDLQIYLYTDGQTELTRRSSRDTTERNRNLENIQKSHQERRIQYSHFMHPLKEKADIILFTDKQGMHIEKQQLSIE
ncbi:MULTISPECIES: uridine kinase family protein [Oceanobacillus]|uniref:Uridine kinase n=2 Tax=Oceanobacillus TaxID=182709 RepID=A0A0A1M9Z6_9BACI|nr:phosphoribulokinase [Oceanobacillus oncorhynchi]MDM8101098.1 phosphoribulokinase [Oceanobacillus oncorhynchi]CEI82165.1 Uridine kinase [Oceanobacillus oncorhynchi]